MKSTLQDINYIYYKPCEKHNLKKTRENYKINLIYKKYNNYIKITTKNT